MRSWRKFLTVAIAGMSLAGCSLGGSGMSRFVHEDVLARAGLRYYWHYKMPLQSGESVVRVYLMDENLYAMTDDNRLIAVDALRGTYKWSFKVADRRHRVFRPYHVEDIMIPRNVPGIKGILDPNTSKPEAAFDGVIVNTLTEMVLLNRSNGEVMRRISFKDFSANSGGASDGSFFYVGATGGMYHAYAIREGVRVWTRSTGGMISAPLEIPWKLLYVASRDESFYAVKAGRGHQLAWRKQLGGPVTAQFHVDDRGCFLPGEDGRIYALNPINGTPLWPPFVCDSALREPIQVGQNTIFQRSDAGSFYAINLTTGKQRWTRRDTLEVIAVFDGKVYLRDLNNNLLIVDEVLGDEKVVMPLTGLELYARNVTVPAIYALTRDGYVFCIRPLEAGRLTLDILKGK